MSGIAGIVHFDGRPVEPGQIEAMTAAMDYRGPDGINHWVHGHVALGQCMLRTTPESLEETQPLANEYGSLVLVMDGRLDNWEELRADLRKRSVALRDRSDTELVLRAYEIWGEGCLDHLDGDFALAIWDRIRQRLFCARDRMGHKPFYYRRENHRFTFASDPAALLAGSSLPALNTGMLAEFLADEFHSLDETLWTGVHRLPPAHALAADSEGRVEVRRYWQLSPLRDVAALDDKQLVERYRELFFDSVRRVSRSHRNLAIEVSGGLDSSAVLCVAQRLLEGGQSMAPGLDAYTLVYPEGDPAREIEYARDVGHHLGIPVDESPPEFHALAWFDEHARRHLDFPGFATTSTSTGLWRRAASNGSRVLLTGENGDIYLTGGYGYYYEELRRGRNSALAVCLAADMSRYGRLGTARCILRHCIASPLLHAVPGALRLLHRSRGRNTRLQQDRPWLTERLRNESSHRHEVHARVAQPLATTRSPGALRRQSPFLFVVQEHHERLAASLGLEPRDPFDTVPFAQFAVSMPERMRLRGGIQKYIHRMALADVLPASVAMRQDKADFVTTFDRRMKHLADIDLPKRTADFPGIYDSTGVRILLERYIADQDVSGWAGWVLWNIAACLPLLTLTTANTDATLSL